MEPVFSGGPGNVQTVGDRSEFIRTTYTYLSGAILAFIALSVVIHTTGIGLAMLKLLSAGKFMWLAYLGAFMVVGWLASYMADNAQSNSTQMVGLGLYTLADALMFAPLFTLASIKVPGSITSAALITLLLVGGLTWTAFSTKKDFSFMGGFLKIAGLVAIGAIIASVIFGFKLGIWFSAIMVLFAGGCVLYDTSNIIHHYPTDRPAGAALHLFASIALMLWYVLRILMSLASSDD